MIVGELEGALVNIVPTNVNAVCHHPSHEYINAPKRLRRMSKQL